jgi:hypothetical protein
VFARVPAAWTGTGKLGGFSLSDGYMDSINPVITLIFGLPMAGKCFPKIDNIIHLNASS